MSPDMLAYVAGREDGPRIETRPVPEIGEHELLVLVKATGVCSTDIRVATGRDARVPPGTSRIPGHEFAGEVADAGSAVRHLFPTGSRVVVAPTIGCGNCASCAVGRDATCPNVSTIGITLDGAFAEYVSVPAAALWRGNVQRIPSTLPMAEAALIEPLACCVRGQRAISISAGDSVVIVGGGVMGLLHALLAQYNGATRVILFDPHEERRARARRFGVDAALHPVLDGLRAVLELTNGAGADAVVIAASSPEAQALGVAAAAVNGRVNLFAGLPGKSDAALEANAIHYRGLTITGTTGADVRDFRTALAIAATGRVPLGEMVTSTFDLRHSKRAFERAREVSEVKVLVVA